MSRQSLFYVGAAAWGIFCFVVLLWAARSAQPVLAAFMVLLASPIALTVLAITLEGRSLAEIVNPMKASWSFIFGDTIFLPLALGMGTLGWQRLPETGWYTSWWWSFIAAVVGLVAGFGFRLFKEVEAYESANASGALLSPTKVLHDPVIYFVLMGSVTFVLIPLIVNAISSGRVSWQVAMMVVMLLGWFAMCYVDAVRGQPGLFRWLPARQPRAMHLNWDPVTFRAVPWE